jgi:hypothetical protein
VPVDLTIGARRLSAQHLAGRRPSTVVDVVSSLGAVQAQDYQAAKWAIGLRLTHPRPTDGLIEEAISSGAVLRTHALRGTWQLVSAGDIRWLLALVGPRVIKGSTGRHRDLELTPATLRRAESALAKSLRGGHLTRDEAAAALEAARVSTAGQRLAHLLGWAELSGLICSGVRRGNQSTYALLDDRVPREASTASREELIARLAGRYFLTRGPATVADFSWWSGLTMTESRAGLEAIRADLAVDRVDGAELWRSRGRPQQPSPGTAYLLSAFDEYLVAYRDRDAVLDPRRVARYNAGGGMLNPTVVIDGRVVGVWRRVLGGDQVLVELDLFEPVSRKARTAIDAAALRYGDFLGRPVRTRLARSARG